MQIFPYFGVPRILHSDNGREFINNVIEGLQAMRHIEIQLVSGRPRHPQSQGLVERAHQTLQKKLGGEIMKSKLKTPPWSEWLPKIACKLFVALMLFDYICLSGTKHLFLFISHIDAMNTQTHEAVGTSPYELVFGQKPRSVLFSTGKSPGIILEESLTDNGICTSTSDSVNEPGLGEMKEALQSKPVVERNDLTDGRKFSAHREVNAQKCNDKVTENEEVDMIIASSEIEKREAQLATMEKHKKVYSLYYNGCGANVLIQCHCLTCVFVHAVTCKR